MSRTTTELETQLQLSLIYKRLLSELTQRGVIVANPEHIQLINDAFNEAVRYLSARCERCDDDLPTICTSCYGRDE